MLVSATALHLVVHFDLENMARVVLPQAGVALQFSSGPSGRNLIPLHAACDLGRRTMLELLLQYGASVNEPGLKRYSW